MTRQELKARAKEQLKGNLGSLILILLIVLAASYLPNLIPGIGTIVSIVVVPALTLAMTIIYLKLAAGEKPNIAEMFQHFDKFWAAFKVSFFTGLFTFLWSLLLVIPGIIKGLSYSMAMYILAENPDMPALEALKKSQEMMDGHKMELFVLYLSFIGWFLLCTVTFGIAGLYVAPLMNATMTNFYLNIKPSAVEVID